MISVSYEETPGIRYLNVSYKLPSPHIGRAAPRGAPLPRMKPLSPLDNRASKGVLEDGDHTSLLIERQEVSLVLGFPSRTNTRTTTGTIFRSVCTILVPVRPRDSNSYNWDLQGRSLMFPQQSGIRYISWHARPSLKALWVPKLQERQDTRFRPQNHA